MPKTTEIAEETGIRCPKCRGDTEVRKTVQASGYVIRSRRCAANPPCGSVTTREAIIGNPTASESIARPKIDLAIRELLGTLGISPETYFPSTIQNPQSTQEPNQ